jgi:hypothetical protein
MGVFYENTGVKIDHFYYKTANVDISFCRYLLKKMTVVNVRRIGLEQNQRQ